MGQLMGRFYMRVQMEFKGMPSRSMELYLLFQKQAWYEIP